MKLIFIFGSAAVGKMTVGQELTKLTKLKLFHNHMTIEPILSLFDDYRGELVAKIREEIFEEFSKSDNYGMIFTYMMAFDLQSEWDYIEHVKAIFTKGNKDTEFYYIELVAPQSIRLKRNVTENRLANKISKRDIEKSKKMLIHDDEKYRLESLDGEISFKNYIKIDNSFKSAEQVALEIKERFNL